MDSAEDLRSQRTGENMLVQVRATDNGRIAGVDLFQRRLIQGLEEREFEEVVGAENLPYGVDDERVAGVVSVHRRTE
jgi:hypothetical protein